MYVWYEPDYPERAFSAAQVRAAWVKAGLDEGQLSLDPLQVQGPEVRRLVRGQLEQAGGAGSATGSASLEIPDEQLPLLESLERFYLTLYPEMKDAPYLKSFHYEELEWLGEY